MECKTACSRLWHCITALSRLTRAKTAWRRLSPPGGAFSGLAPPLPAYTDFIQMRAAKSAPGESYTDSGCRIPAQMYTIPFWLDRVARTELVPSWAHSASRALCPERRRAASTRRLQEKVSLSSSRSAYGVKNKMTRSHAACLTPQAPEHQHGKGVCAMGQ